jgi:hypothetical protein
MIVKEHYGKLLSTLFWPICGTANGGNLTIIINWNSRSTPGRLQREVWALRSTNAAISYSGIDPC